MTEKAERKPYHYETEFYRQPRMMAVEPCYQEVVDRPGWDAAYWRPSRFRHAKSVLRHNLRRIIAWFRRANG